MYDYHICLSISPAFIRFNMSSIVQTSSTPTYNFTRYGQVDPDDARRFAQDTLKETKTAKDQMYTVLQREYMQNIQSGRVSKRDHELSRNSLMNELDVWAKGEQVSC